jgi:mono/diheme cytochrome c family protein
MLNRLLVIAVAAMLAAGTSYADQSKAKVTIPITKTTASSGKMMYSNYCAPCHGVDGRGQGPVASALKTSPTDLTVLSRNNHGKFPDTHVVSVLQSGAEMPSHGSAEMPVWGPIFGKMNQANPQDRLLRISNLSRYLEGLQTK